MSLVSKIIVFCLLLFLPIFVKAEIVITEIMYNPESTDSDREWIEIYNSGSEIVDLSDYKLLENDVNHKLSAHNPENDEKLELEPQKYAIIADNSLKFSEEYSINGLLIDSVFSLRNDGEVIYIVDNNENIIDSVEYLPDWGADGNGNSLQKVDLQGSNTGENWISANPTPFSINKTESDESSSESGSNSDDSDNSGDSSDAFDSQNNSSKSTHSAVNDISIYSQKIDFKVSAGRNRYTSINTPIKFKLIHNQDSNKGVYASWSMGDGQKISGRDIDHTYLAEGVYNLVLNSSNGEESAVSRIKVYVSKPNISLEYEKSGKTVDVLLKNKTKQEVNIGGFYLEFNGKEYVFSKDTIISGNSEFKISGLLTDFNISLKNIKSTDIKLRYPNGFLLGKILFRLDPLNDRELILSLIEKAQE